MSRFQYESIKLVHLFPGLQKARLLRCHIEVMFMTLWKISLVECVQHVHMLELRNWRSFQEELPSFVLLCSSTMSFHRMLTLFGAVLNCVLLTITITVIYSFWYPANSGFSRLDATLTLQRERNYCKWLFAFPSSMCIHVTLVSKTWNDTAWFAGKISISKIQQCDSNESLKKQQV